ncbi:MAG TPA: family 78 glycoside hydrolase catalytic domain [Jiangellales bacterium]|nr:family 78 glycoside hydrolase catalytic domain [Jiangellales bacterium]
MTLAVTAVRLEYRSDSPVVGVPRPRVSWKVATDTPEWTQAAAEMEWVIEDSRHVAALSGSTSHLVPWPFEALGPRDRGRLRVRVTGPDGVASPWSDPVDVFAGHLADGEWVAQFIGLPEPSAYAQPALLRTEFDVTGEVRAATLYATAHGVYQVELNGQEVDDQILKPGWTAYQYRLVHETTDVTHHLRAGRNAVGTMLAGGWFTERYGFAGRARTIYGDQPRFAAMLVIDYADGTQQTVRTDTGWRVSGNGPVVASGIYAGETYDARRFRVGWAQPGFDDTEWVTASVANSSVIPSARSGPVVRAIEELAVLETITSPSGRTILDFGQNLVGRVRIRLAGPAGHTVRLRHAEVLEDGELATRLLRAADATDSYTLAGQTEEVWEPRFTFHGFRYVEIEGWPGAFDPAAVTAVVIHSDMERTGRFECSHPLLNRLHENVVWGMRGNFLSLPTDCPQRDERLGWTGDIQVFAPTASYLYDCNGFLASWLVDLALEQSASGGVPFVVPDVLDSAATPAAAWGDAATIVPSVLYERFADVGLLREQYPSMRRWVDQILDLAGQDRLWEGTFQFGDWLDPAAPPDRPGEAKTDPDLVASAYLFRSADLLARTAARLGQTVDAQRYADAAEAVRAAWMNRYTSPDGRIVSDTQTAYALAIVFNIVRDPQTVERMGERLAALIRRAGYRIGTGFVGTPHVADALTDTGHVDVATRLLLETECPSWLYAVIMGATTIWERWDGILPDGTINPGEMTSFNHYAFGAIADWMHRVIAGLAPREPGYRELVLAPRPAPGLDWARAELETPYGRAAVAWEASAGTITITATVPPNTRARVSLPAGSGHFDVGSGHHSWAVADTREPYVPPRQSLTGTLEPHRVA